MTRSDVLVLVIFVVLLAAVALVAAAQYADCRARGLGIAACVSGR